MTVCVVVEEEEIDVDFSEAVSAVAGAGPRDVNTENNEEQAP